MAFALATFRLRFPEFRTASDAMIQSFADAADKDIAADVYGDKADEARLYLTAHKLAISPFGRNARLVNEDGTTTYWSDYERIKRLVRQPIVVT
jgi:hypothetical protein